MSDEDQRFVRQIASLAARKLRAQRDARRPIWFGLGMFGTIGWSVALPTVAGALLGLWWDRHHPGSRSWTLALLVAGLIVGCANAWHWVSKEDKAMHDEENIK
ncbi:MAG: AtpZ/AtpI family protein [Pseudomonadota bacterium]|nr:AtpZ/AtpI family protein [Pseudomonadota bacterium]